jgi:hypothetical protein
MSAPRARNENANENEVEMYLGELQKLEGVWIGREMVVENGQPSEATARLVFQTVFDGRFLLCDYVQSFSDRPTSVGHGVFRRDDRTDALTVTWFRSPAATSSQQANGVAEGNTLVFIETIGARTTRTSYKSLRDQLSIRTECAAGDDQWKPVLEGSYRRR